MTETYRVLLDMQPQALFDGLMTRHPGVLEGFRHLMQFAGGAFLLLGHSQRMAEVGKRGMEATGEIVRTLVLCILIFAGGQILGILASVFANVPAEIDAPVSSGSLITQLWERARQFPDPMEVFSKPEGKDAGKDASTLEGSIKAATSGDTVRETADEAEELSFWSLSDWFYRLGQFLSRLFMAIARLGLAVLVIGVLLLGIIASMFIIWCMEAFRYLALVVGACLLPLFIGFLSTEHMRSAGWNYILTLIGICAWPIGWALGHAITIELFDLWLRVATGESSMAVINNSIENGEGLANLGTYASMSFLQSSCLALGLLGLFLWILLVAFVAPLLIAKTLTTGAEFAAAFMGKGVQTTVGTAGKLLVGAATVAAAPAALSAISKIAPAASAGGSATPAAGAAGGVSGGGSGLTMLALGSVRGVAANPPTLADKRN
ncbi:hypothetical protein OPIT5_00275 (plasmid) [Opitutaceae bacterium TAV5]|nr:hypothetical protein OPIT5_00275 [Opitutaceae bacterium TAV5]